MTKKSTIGMFANKEAHKSKKPSKRDDADQTLREYSVLISNSGRTFELISRPHPSMLHDPVMQNQPLDKNGKLLLGVGKYGVVRFVREQQGDHYVYYAVKKIKLKYMQKQNPEWPKETKHFLMKEFESESIFQNKCKEIPDKALLNGLMLDEDRVTIRKGKKIIAIYQIMQIGSYGDGQKLKVSISKVPVGEMRKKLTYMVCCQLLDIFSRMDAQGIYHIDFKLDNLLVDKDGKCKICDFGAAYFFDENDNLKCKVGSSFSVVHSPFELENINSGEFTREVAKKIDAWRLGLVLMDLLGGEEAQELLKKLLNKANRHDFFSKINDENFCNELNNQIKAALKKDGVTRNVIPVVCGLLALNPEKRLAVSEAKKMFPEANFDDPQMQAFFSDDENEFNSQLSSSNSSVAEYRNLSGELELSSIFEGQSEEEEQDLDDIEDEDKDKDRGLRKS